MNMKMEKQQIKQLFNQFLTHYDTEAKDAVWQAQSKRFRDFWNEKIMIGGQEELNDAEVDQTKTAIEVMKKYEEELKGLEN